MFHYRYPIMFNQGKTKQTPLIRSLFFLSFSIVTSKCLVICLLISFKKNILFIFKFLLSLSLSLYTSSFYDLINEWTQISVFVKYSKLDPLCVWKAVFVIVKKQHVRFAYCACSILLCVQIPYKKNKHVCWLWNMYERR